MITVDFNRIKIKPGFRVLDAGCGQGRHLGESFRRPGAHVVGVDRGMEDLAHTRNMMRLMEKEGEGGGGSWETLQADVTKLPFADNSFDLVICSEVLEHIPEDDKAIREIVRVLKPGECLAVSVPRFFPESVCWALSKTYRTDPGGHVRVYRQKELIRKLEASGVRCVATGRAHALHAPYWWIKCICGLKNEEAWPVKMYHKFLVWDIMKRPWLTRTLDRLLNPVMSKSCVLYLEKTGD
jgi:ubiquinone/menaquinone biosynthesis C-methylase UbiE